MRANIYEGYYENGQFHISGKMLKIPERQRVLFTVFDEREQMPLDGEKEQRIAWLERLQTLISLSMDEELLYIPRSRIMHNPLDLSD